jgi:elongation factor 1-beta
VNQMGEVAMIFKLMPSGVEVDLEVMKENVKNCLPEEINLNKIEEKPIAFGLVALEVQIIMNDRGGGGDEVERLLSEVQDVNSVELVHMGLL